MRSKWWDGLLYCAPSHPAEVTYAGYLEPSELIVVEQPQVTYPSSSTLASRSFFPASFALSIAKASSFVIASEMYRNAADRTSSSCEKNIGVSSKTQMSGCIISSQV
jgi:hypothetical protein